MCQVANQYGVFPKYILEHNLLSKVKGSLITWLISQFYFQYVHSYVQYFAVNQHTPRKTYNCKKSL